MATPAWPQGQEPDAGPHGREAMLSMDRDSVSQEAAKGTARAQETTGREEGHGLQPMFCAS